MRMRHSSDRRLTLLLPFAAGVLAVLACGPLGGAAPPTATLFEAPPTEPPTEPPVEEAASPTPEPPAAPTETPTVDFSNANVQLTAIFDLTNVALTATVASGSLSQWAIVATASSQYGDPDFAASKATGAPHVYPNCGENPNSWASGGAGTPNEFLQLVYATPVIPTRIDIYETQASGSIVQVEVVDEAGVSHIVYQGIPMQAPCPRILSVGVIGIDFKVNGVIVRLNQSVVGGWNEIDAVQLVGNP